MMPDSPLNDSGTMAPPPDYEIVESLGAGELGEVFRARRRETGAEVAIRLVNADLLAAPGTLDALREMVINAQAALHPHLGQQFDLDETASPALVVEYVQGRKLLDIMRERGVAPPAAVVDLGTRLCAALAAAHNAGIAHGRVHAGNVLLESGTLRWVLLDAGQRAAIENLEPAYDLYSLGTLLYELGTGHSAFETEGVPADPRAFVATMPAELSAVLLRAVDPEPARWFASAEELGKALAAAL
jgi:serine/threonine-protein kinase